MQPRYVIVEGAVLRPTCTTLTREARLAERACTVQVDASCRREPALGDLVDSAGLDSRSSLVSIPKKGWGQRPLTRIIRDDQILDAALTVVVERGYLGATTRAIAKAAGVNEVTLFRRFGSKDKLLGAAIGREAQRFEALGVTHTGD